jgi:hypothetical protein
MFITGRTASAFCVTVFLCAAVFAQAASLAFAYPHDSGHCCQLCHLGPLPFLEPAPTAAIAPILALAWYSGAGDTGTAHEALLMAASSRAPPSFFQA